MAAAKKRAADSDVIVTIALEFLAVGLFTLIAGASNEMGTVMVIFMVGMWMIYMITESGTIAKLEKALEAA